MIGKNEYIGIDKRDPDAGLRKGVPGMKGGSAEMRNIKGDDYDTEKLVNERDPSRRFITPEDLVGEDEDSIIAQVDNAIRTQKGENNVDEYVVDGQPINNSYHFEDHELRKQKRYFAEAEEKERIKSVLDSALTKAEVEKTDANLNIQDSLVVKGVSEKIRMQADRRFAGDKYSAKDNLKTLSNSKAERQNRGAVRRFLDKYF